jgi:hypothetical protein
VPPEFFLKNAPTILRYRQLSNVTNAAATGAAERMALELSAARGQHPELDQYTTDLYCYRDLGPDGLAD